MGIFKRKKKDDVAKDAVTRIQDGLKRAVKEVAEEEDLKKEIIPTPSDDTPVYTSLDEVIMGAVYKDVTSGFIGIVELKMECLTGCDRVVLGAPASSKNALKRIECDITCLEYVDEGVAKRFDLIKYPNQIDAVVPALPIGQVQHEPVKPLARTGAPSVVSDRSY